MFARARLVTEDIAEAVILPDSAVVNRFGESFVFVLEAPTEENGDVLENDEFENVARVAFVLMKRLKLSKGLKKGMKLLCADKAF